jgi:hypothetical protein
MVVSPLLNIIAGRMTAGRTGNPKVARIGNLVLVEHRQIIESGKPYTPIYTNIHPCAPHSIAVKCIRKERDVRIGSTNKCWHQVRQPQQSLRHNVLR